MNARLEYLKQRRKLLISRAAAQRREVEYITMNVKQRLWLVDMGFAIVQGLRIKPTLAAASATLLLPAPRNKLLLWGSRLFTAWELYSLVRKQLRAVE